MKICLINPPCIEKNREHIKYNHDFRNMPHLGLGYICSFLEQNGFEVDILECDQRGLSLDDLYPLLSREKYEAIGVSVYPYNLYNAIRIITIIKKLEPIPFVFLGGFTSTISYHTLLPLVENVGCCVRGEGEYTCLELMEAIRDKKDWHNIPGVAYKEGDITRIAPPRQLPDELDNLPFPKRAFISEFGFVTMLTSRGCYGKCTFCELREFQKACSGKAVRTRSPENVVKEIEFLVNECKVKSIAIVDDNFLIASLRKREWLLKFYELMRAKTLSVQLRVAARANDIIANRDIIEKLKEVGLTGVFIGVESFVQRQLDYYNKKVTVEENIKALEIVHEMNIKISIGWLIYEPFVTLKEIRENIRIFKSVFHENFEGFEADFQPISLRTPVILYPGTQIREQIVNQGLYIATEQFGYVFQDEDVALLRKILVEWGKFLNPVFLMFYLIIEANERNNFTLENKLMTEKGKLIDLDLRFIEDACDCIENKRISLDNCKDSIHDIILKWKSALDSINNEFLNAKALLCK
ncbi:MAG: B12-binding domain-containing radical SAM protein [Firmicutes bacterium]|nr:B12-binding domain-containing radical SAM protein [Bacillota bacterium]